MKLLNSMPPYTLFGVENQNYEKARIVVLPIPYDSTTTYKAGARDGPHAIIDASRNMEFYSEEFGLDITENIGIYTLDELAPDLDSPEKMVNRIEKEVTNVLSDSKVPLLIGGEHTIAVGSIRAVAKKYKDFSVLHFDAHSDYRDEYMGSRYCHACIMARAREACPSCLSVGVRSIDKESARRYEKDILYRKEMHRMSTEEVIQEIRKRTRKRLYITIDMDVMDPSEVPSLGTPEPDGLRFNEITTILKGVLQGRELLGVDFNELAPIPGIIAPNYLVAKLIFLTIGYAFIQGPKS